MQQFFKIVGKLVLPKGAHIPYPGAKSGSLFVIQLFGENIIVQAVQLQAKEQGQG